LKILYTFAGQFAGEISKNHFSQIIAPLNS